MVSINTTPEVELTKSLPKVKSSILEKLQEKREAANKKPANTRKLLSIFFDAKVFEVFI
jgi:uncharacterized protein (DUF4415 family)